MNSFKKRPFPITYRLYHKVSLLDKGEHHFKMWMNTQGMKAQCKLTRNLI